MRILVIEDEEKIRSHLKLLLESECFAVDSTGDGGEGSFLARSNEYDAIILDNMLPTKHGKDICTEIRKASISTPILMLSVKYKMDIKVDLLNAGADDYMTKPFSSEELLARIKALIRRQKKVNEEVFNICGLAIDIKNQTVRRGERDIYLTRKEFMLLDYLLRNRGSIVTRGMLLEHVWNMNADPFSNTIEAHIKSLRNKLEARSKLIHTVPGRGYKIV
jgi:DNA-binding response OmpR family regulator